VTPPRPRPRPGRSAWLRHAPGRAVGGAGALRWMLLHPPVPLPCWIPTSRRRSA